MKNICKHITTILAAVACFSAISALAMEPMAATIKISSGGIYDYVIIGESPKATDGFDNAYDTLSPGSSLNGTFISSYFSHPEWASVKKNFRGDIRSLAEKQEWVLFISSTLPAGTPLTVELQSGLNILPQGLQLTVKDIGNTTTANLIGGRLSIAAPAPGTTIQLIITALQTTGTVVVPPTVAPPSVIPPAVIPPSVAPPAVTPPAVAPPAVAPPAVTANVDGDIDGDGQVTITDAIKVLRMALGLDIFTANAQTHGDMDGDGKLTIRDALMLVRKSIGL